MYEYPPILKGTEQQQLAALRDYLVRMARSLRSAEEAAEEAADRSAALSAAGGTADAAAADTAALAAGSSALTAAAETGDAAAALLSAGQLRALIQKTADRIETVRQSVDRVDAALREDYLAVSDFGEYTARAALNMTATARQVVEGYDYAQRIDAVGAALDAMDSYLTAIRGEIRRGLITDPETGEQVLGIAVAENLRFTGQTHSADGLTYYELSPGQTLGLYTATGWQFWINGAKRGWFDSADSMLHVTRLRAVDSIDLGGSWRLSSAGGLGIKYLGG